MKSEILLCEKVYETARRQRDMFLYSWSSTLQATRLIDSKRLKEPSGVYFVAAVAAYKKTHICPLTSKLDVSRYELFYALLVATENVF